MKHNKICEGIYEPKLKFKFGEELFNQKNIYNLMNKRKTSIMKEIKLLFPNELKQQLLQIVSNIQKSDKLDVEMMRFNYPNVFWSLIFYFDLNNIDKTFMLPYLSFDSNKVLENNTNDNIEYFYSKQEQNDNEKDKCFNITKNFNFQKYFLQKNEIKKYNTENLCIQNVYNLGLIDNILYSYKNVFSYEENISYNELPLIIFEKETHSPIYKRSSAVYVENENYNDFVVIDSIAPYAKRNSDTNLLANINLRLTQGIIPLDNHLLIRLILFFLLFCYYFPLHLHFFLVF